MQPEQFLRGYLIGFMLWLGLSLGCMALLMVQHLSGGLWGLSIRRILEAASKGLPLMAVLFLPIAVADATSLYAWMTDASLTEHNAWYLNTPGWIGAVRAVLRDLAGHGVRAEQALGAAGPAADGGQSAALPAIQRHWLAAVRADDFVRQRGLGDVARSALGIDHLRHDLHGGRRAVGAGVLHHHADGADALQPVSARSSSRSSSATWAS